MKPTEVLRILMDKIDIAIKQKINYVISGYDMAIIEASLKESPSDAIYSEHEADFLYFAGVFNVSGIDGLQKEIERLKGIGKNPHDIIIASNQ